LISFKTAKEKAWKSLEKAWKKLGKVCKKLGEVWKSLEKFALEASALRNFRFAGLGADPSRRRSAALWVG
jgi:hypothetical protein